MTQHSPRLLPALAALNGLLGVAIGAFGAHAVPNPQAQAWISTGAAYGLAHAAAAFAVMGRSRPAAWTMTFGALLFAASLYTLALTGKHWLGMIAPVGGLLMMTGWALMIGQAVRGGGTGAGQ